MGQIKIYNDDLHDMIVMKKISKNNAYDRIEELLKNGNQIMFYNSSLDNNPTRIFSKIEEFKVWRKLMNDESQRIENLFTPSTENTIEKP